MVFVHPPSTLVEREFLAGYYNFSSNGDKIIDIMLECCSFKKINRYSVLWFILDVKDMFHRYIIL